MVYEKRPEEWIRPEEPPQSSREEIDRVHSLVSDAVASGNFGDVSQANRARLATDIYAWLTKNTDENWASSNVLLFDDVAGRVIEAAHAEHAIGRVRLRDRLAPMNKQERISALRATAASDVMHARRWNETDVEEMDAGSEEQTSAV